MFAYVCAAVAKGAFQPTTCTPASGTRHGARATHELPSLLASTTFLRRDYFCCYCMVNEFCAATLPLCVNCSACCLQSLCAFEVYNWRVYSVVQLVYAMFDPQRIRTK